MATHFHKTRTAILSVDLGLMCWINYAHCHFYCRYIYSFWWIHVTHFPMCCQWSDPEGFAINRWAPNHKNYVHNFGGCYQHGRNRCIRTQYILRWRLSMSVSVHCTLQLYHIEREPQCCALTLPFYWKWSTAKPTSGALFCQQILAKPVPKLNNLQIITSK